MLYLCHQEAASFLATANSAPATDLTVPAPDLMVTATFFSPDDRWVVSLDTTGTAKVGDWEAEQEVFTFGSPSNRVGCVAFHPDCRQLAAAMGANGVWIWATTNWLAQSSGRGQEAHSDSALEEDRQPLLFLRPHNGEVTALAYSPNGERLVTGGSDGSLTLWNSAKGQQLSTLGTTNQPIRRVAIGPDDQRIVAVAERAAWVWKLESGELIRAFPSGTNAPTAAVFSDDTGQYFASVDKEDRLALWREGRPPLQLITIQGRYAWVGGGVFFSPGGRGMVTSSVEAGEVAYPGRGQTLFEVWDIEQSPRGILDCLGRDGFTGLWLSPDGRTVACSSFDFCVHRWETFPWREEEYAQTGGQKSEVSDRRLEALSFGAGSRSMRGDTGTND